MVVVVSVFLFSFCIHCLIFSSYRLLAKSLKVEKELIAILDRLSTPLLKIFQVSGVPVHANADHAHGSFPGIIEEY